MRKTILTVLILVLALFAGSPSAAAVKDKERPTVGFTTGDGSVLAAAPADAGLSAVKGWAKDDVSGIRRVTVSYCPGSKASDGSWTCGSTGALGFLTTTKAALTCNSTRRSCTWTAAVPQHPGTYLAFVKATDRTGRSRSAGPIQVYVV